MPAVDVMPAWIARLEADATLRTLLGGAGRIYPLGTSRSVQVPSVEWVASGVGYRELFEVAQVQWDIFARTWSAVWAIEARIRALSHRDVMQTMGTTPCWARYTGARTIPFPSDPGVMHRALEFVLETVRPELAH